MSTGLLVPGSRFVNPTEGLDYIRVTKYNLPVGKTSGHCAPDTLSTTQSDDMTGVNRRRLGGAYAPKLHGKPKLLRGTTGCCT